MIHKTDYPPLTFSTGLDVDGMDMAEWVSHAYHDLFRARLALELWEWVEQATMADSIGGELLELLESMKERALVEAADAWEESADAWNGGADE